MKTVMKTCTKCGALKPVWEFYKMASGFEGYRSKCKVCWKAYGDAHRKTARGRAARLRSQRRYRRSEKGKAWWQRYYASEKNKGNKRRYAAETRKKHSAQVEVRTAVGKAVRSGKMPPASTLSCEDCGGQAGAYHHEDYGWEHRFDVTPLCRSCHQRRHGPAVSNMVTLEEVT